MAQDLQEKNSSRPRADLREPVSRKLEIGEPVSRKLEIGEPVSRKLEIGEPVSRKLEIGADFFKTRINLVVVALLFAGIFLMALGAGLFFFKNSGSDGDDIQIISSDINGSSASEVVVHVDGAVVASGVYKLAENARVNDAIAAAGGLTAEADQTRINLAAKVEDGQKIYVWAVGQKDGGMVGGTAGVSVSALININTATESELDKLPGVGPVTAGKIIASRPYSAPEDLKIRKVVSASVFEKIRDLITVY